MSVNPFTPGAGERWGRWWLLVPAIAAINWIGGALGLMLALPPGYATFVFPPAGLSLGCLLLYGNRIWPGVWLGLFCVYLSLTLGLGLAEPIRVAAVAAALGTGVSVQALGGAWLVRRFVGFPHPLDTERAVVGFLGLAGPLSCCIGATVATTALWLAGIVPPGSVSQSWWTWWAGDTIGVLIFAPLVLIACGRPREVWRPRRLSVALPLAVLLLAVVLLFMRASAWDEARLKLAFSRQAQHLANALVRGIDSHIDVLRAVEGFFAASQLVERDEFGAFARTIMLRHPGFEALGWAPRVPAARRAAYEASVRKEGIAGFEITQLDRGGGRQRAAGRADYFPLRYLEPVTGNDLGLGFDLYSDPVSRAALERARDTGRSVASGRARFLRGTQHGLLFLHPLYRKETAPGSPPDGRTRLAGFTLGVFRLGDMVRGALSEMDRPGVVVRIEDDSAPPPQRVLYEEKPREPVTAAAAHGQAAPGPMHRVGYNAHGRRWTLSFSPTPEYLPAQRSWQAWAVLAAGLLFISLIETFLLVITGRGAKVEVMVAERTAELNRLNAVLREEIAVRERTEVALRESEQRLATIVAHSPEAITILDVDTGRWVDVNAKAERLFGLPREALLERGPVLQSPAMQADGLPSNAAAAAHIEEALNGDTPTFEWIHTNAAGDPIACEIRLVRLPQTGRRLVRASLTDISARKRAEDQLRRAKEAAESASRAKTEFLASMSHELRTPLNSVLGYAQLLRRQAGLSEAQAKALGTIQTSGEHLLSLIDEILDMAKIEAGTLEIRAGQFHLPELLEGLAGIVRSRAEDKGLSFTCAYLSPLPTIVSADPRRLRQVLMNLLDNAIKYTPSGGVALKVGVLDGRLRFLVEDTGIGIRPEHLGEIFDIFHQLRDPRTHAQGTGLGLAIAKRLVQLMGGDLRVQSEPDEGTRFWFELDLPEIGAAPPALAARKILAVQGSRRRVLVVEDDPDSRSLFRDLLVPLGFELYEAADGAEGVRQAQAHQPDAILMDMRMPVVDGLEATRRIRALPELKPPLIIAISASAFEHNRARCLEAGADDFLPKPFRHERLLDLLSTGLGLTLIYGDASNEVTPLAPRTPPPECLQALLEAARRGDRRGLLERAQEAEQRGYAPFATEVRGLVEGFKMKKLRTWLEELMVVS